MSFLFCITFMSYQIYHCFIINSDHFYNYARDFCYELLGGHGRPLGPKPSLPNTPRYSVPSWTEKYFPNLRVLSLNRAGLDTEAAQKLSTLLQTNSALLTNLQHLDVSRNEIEVNGLLALGDKFVLRRHGKLIFNCAGNVMKREERGTVSLYLNFACPKKELIMEDSVELTESHGRLLVELIFRQTRRQLALLIVCSSRLRP